MAHKHESKPLLMQTTNLYDPVIGFIYATELFEKDLYREKIMDARATTAGHVPGGQKSQTGRANP